MRIWPRSTHWTHLASSPSVPGLDLTAQLLDGAEHLLRARLLRLGLRHVWAGFEHVATDSTHKRIFDDEPVQQRSAALLTTAPSRPL